MTGEGDHDHVSDLDAERDPDSDTSPDSEAVRRLLADARASEPMPASVAARLDDVLAGLRPSAPGGSAVRGSPTSPMRTVDPGVRSIASHRRRRAAGMLVAAAAIVVGGVVVAQQLPDHGGSSGASATAGGAASEDRAAGLDASSAQPPGTSPQDAERAPARVRNGRVLVRPQHFTADADAARRLLHRPAAARLMSLDASCDVARGSGQRISATYQRAPAVLLFRRPASGTQVVDLFVCGSPRPVRSATLPHP